MSVRSLLGVTWLGRFSRFRHSCCRNIISNDIPEFVFRWGKGFLVPARTHENNPQEDVYKTPTNTGIAHNVTLDTSRIEGKQVLNDWTCRRSIGESTCTWTLSCPSVAKKLQNRPYISNLPKIRNELALTSKYGIAACSPQHQRKCWHWKDSSSWGWSQERSEPKWFLWQQVRSTQPTAENTVSHFMATRECTSKPTTVDLCTNHSAYACMQISFQHFKFYWKMWIEY